MKYKYKGENPVILPTLHLSVSPGDVIEVEEPIENPHFEAVKPKPSTKEGEN